MKRIIILFMLIFVTVAYAANLTSSLKIEKNSNLKYYIVNDSKHLLRAGNGKLDKYDTIASSESFYADLLYFKNDGDRLFALVALSNVITYEKDPGRGMEIKSKNDIEDLNDIGGEMSFSSRGLDAKVESLDNINSLSYLLLPDIMNQLKNLAFPLPSDGANVGEEWSADKIHTQKYEFATLESMHQINYKLIAFKDYKGHYCAEVDFVTKKNTYNSANNITAFKSKIMGKAMIEAKTGIVVNLQISNDFNLIAEDNGMSYQTETSSFTEYALRSKE